MCYCQYDNCPCRGLFSMCSIAGGGAESTHPLHVAHWLLIELQRRSLHFAHRLLSRSADVSTVNSLPKIGWLSRLASESMVGLCAVVEPVCTASFTTRCHKLFCVCVCVCIFLFFALFLFLLFFFRCFQCKKRSYPVGKLTFWSPASLFVAVFVLVLQIC